jgi:hypothetical protein
MAPRGIVAGATASAFGIQLTQAGLAGRGRSSLTFVAILGSVVLWASAPRRSRGSSAWPAAGVRRC